MTTRIETGQAVPERQQPLALGPTEVATHLSWKNQRTIWPALFAALLALAAYVTTLAPTVFYVDSAELTTAAYTLGIAHSPGYPVYLLLAHLFALLPIGDVGYRVNLFSAVAAASTVAILVIVIKRLTGQTLPALAAGLSFGFNYYVWFVSVAAEVYTLQGLLLAGLLLAGLDWLQTRRPRSSLLAAWLAGLALANNPASMLWWPGLIVLICWPVFNTVTQSLGHLVPKGGYRQALYCFAIALPPLPLLGAFLLGLLPLLYLPIRSASHPNFVYAGEYDTTGTFISTDLTQPVKLLAYLAGQQFHWLMFTYPPAGVLAEIGQFFYRLWASFLGIGLPLGLWGAWRLWRRDRGLLAGLALTAIPHAIFFINYSAPDKDTMFLPVFLVWAILLGIGLDALESAVRLPVRFRPRRLAIGLLLPAVLLTVNRPFANVDQVWAPHNVAQARLAQADPQALYFSVWGDAAAMQYLQAVYGWRPDVTVVNVFFTSPATLQAMIDRALAAGRTVYSTEIEPAWGDEYGFAPINQGYIVYRGRKH